MESCLPCGPRLELAANTNLRGLAQKSRQFRIYNSLSLQWSETKHLTAHKELIVEYDPVVTRACSHCSGADGIQDTGRVMVRTTRHWDESNRKNNFRMVLALYRVQA